MQHGAMHCASFHVDSYSVLLRERGKLLGDSVSRPGFRRMLGAWRELWTTMEGRDPFGKMAMDAVQRRWIDDVLDEDSAAGTVVRAAVEDYALQLAHVVAGFLRQKTWRRVQRVVMGGGFSKSAHGERAIARASALMRLAGHAIELRPLHHHADEGGLVGWVHLAPEALLREHDAILAVDIGGTNVRCGIVRVRRKDGSDTSTVDVVRREKWRHASDDEVTRREHMLQGVADILTDLIAHAAKKKLRLAPFVGVATPGLIREDGSIQRGTQNLPGDWESRHFHLPAELGKRLPAIHGIRPAIGVHNDAVVQGLSELPYMQDIKHWAVLTVGTGLGNASYTNVH